MGSIIREDTEGEPSAALTETGKGGLLSQGYLRDEPAREYVGDGETPVFVLTDGETGVERQQEGDRTSMTPGKGYRAITVVTDRRVIVLVGNADDGGDRRVTLPLVETTAARAEDGTLVLEMNSGITWRCHADDAGIDEVADYVTAAATAWRDVEETLASVKRSIVEGTAHRDDGDYEAALASMRDARDGIEAVQERTVSFGEHWPGGALAGRVEAVRDRCLRTAAEIRVGYARATIDEGEEYWRAGEYERARDAFEDALEAYEAVRSLPDGHREGVEDVDRAIERLERSMERLDDAPLRTAIDADRRARETDPSLEALDALAEARERYAVVLELGPADGERRFAGDRDRIREQREDVTDRFVETALSVGTEALETGEWYCETGQSEFAEEALERSVEALERGLSIAETERPAQVETLRKHRSTARELLADMGEASEETEVGGAADGAERGDSVGGSRQPRDSEHPVKADDGTAPTPVDDETISAGGPDHDGKAGDTAAPDGGRTARAPSVDAPVGGADDGRPAQPATSNDRTTATIETTLRDLEPDQFERVVTAVVEAMGWRPEPTASAACDYLAERTDDERTLAIRSFPNGDDEPLDAETVEECADMASSVPTVDDVMVVTTRPLTDDAVAAARNRQIRLVDLAYLASALGGPGAEGSGPVGVDPMD